MVWRYIITLVYRHSTNIVKIYVYASERARKFWHIYIISKSAISFYILSVLQIFCRYN